MGVPEVDEVVARDAMLRSPTVHPASLTVGQARDAFARSPKTHLLLLVDGPELRGTLTRDDLPAEGDDATPALDHARLVGRTVGPDDGLAEVRAALVADGNRRVAVVDGSGVLLGLVCLNRRLDGFCTDAGVAAMRAARGVGPAA